MDARPADEAATIRDLLASELPGLVVDTVQVRGEGLENIAYDINGEFILRLNKERDPDRRASTVAKEAALLRIVATFSTLPIPEPTVVADRALLYRTLAGRPLIDTPAARRTPIATAIAAELGGFLAALHAVPADLLADLVEIDDDPMEQWLAEANDSYRTAFGVVPAAARSRIEAFLATPPPGGPHDVVFSHNDLGIEHVLVDPETAAVTGILDWTDAALVDRAYDFGLLQRDLGRAALDAALSSYPADKRAGIDERAEFYARCSVLEDLAWGDTAGREPYVRKGLEALGSLFG